MLQSSQIPKMNHDQSEIQPLSPIPQEQPLALDLSLNSDLIEAPTTHQDTEIQSPWWRRNPFKRKRKNSKHEGQEKDPIDMISEWPTSESYQKLVSSIQEFGSLICSQKGLSDANPIRLTWLKNPDQISQSQWHIYLQIENPNSPHRLIILFFNGAQPPSEYSQLFSSDRDFTNILALKTNGNLNKIYMGSIKTGRFKPGENLHDRIHRYMYSQGKDPIQSLVPYPLVPKDDKESLSLLENPTDFLNLINQAQKSDNSTRKPNPLWDYGI